jgi:hypothetical protein
MAIRELDPPRAAVIDRSQEAVSFLEAITTTEPGALSACDGWTTHEIAAHVTGIAVEVNRHLDPFLQGDPVPNTRSFEEREAPLRAMDHDQLLASLTTEEQRMRNLVAAVLAQDADTVIPWTGRQMAVAKFIPHLRNEHALHRWDVVGDDEASISLLSQNDLTEHSVEVLGKILLRAGRHHDPEPGAAFCGRLRVEGQRDLLVIVDDETASLRWDNAPTDQAAEGSQVDVTMDPAARHLFIWGRRPDTRGRIHSGQPAAHLARLQILLSGY